MQGFLVGPLLARVGKVFNPAGHGGVGKPERFQAGLAIDTIPVVSGLVVKPYLRQ